MSKAAVQKFEMEMLSELEALIADVTKTGRGALLPLDRSYASLDRVEDYYMLVLDKKVAADKARATLRVARYTGATLVEQAGGKWAAGDNDAVPAVTKLRAAPKDAFEPLAIVSELESFRFTGWLRDRTERHDLDLQKKRIAELADDTKGTLARLRSAAKELAGSDPGLLDTTAALDRYQPVLARAAVANAPRELRRAIQRGAAIGMGALLQSELGRSAWTLDDDPRSVDFGAWMLFGINFTNIVERVEAEDAVGALRTMAEKMIAKRKKKT